MAFALADDIVLVDEPRLRPTRNDRLLFILIGFPESGFGGSKLFERILYSLVAFTPHGVGLVIVRLVYAL